MSTNIYKLPLEQESYRLQKMGVSTKKFRPAKRISSSRPLPHPLVEEVEPADRDPDEVPELPPIVSCTVSRVQPTVLQEQVCCKLQRNKPPDWSDTKPLAEERLPLPSSP